MRTVLSKSRGALLAIVRGVKRSRQERFERATEKNSTMSDTIGLAVLITSLLVLSHGMPIEYGNRKENDFGQSAPTRKRK